MFVGVEKKIGLMKNLSKVLSSVILVRGMSQEGSRVVLDIWCLDFSFFWVFRFYGVEQKSHQFDF